MKIFVLLFALSLSIANSRYVYEDKQLPFSLEEIFTVKVGSLKPTWISDREVEFKNKTTNDIMKYNVVTNEMQVLLSAAALKKFNYSSYEFSSDCSHVLIGYNEQSKYRHSAIAKYVVYSLKEDVYTDIAEKSYLQIAKWIPKRNSIVYVKDNNIYCIESLKGKFESFPISVSGIPDLVFNGINDWIYEEEVLHKATSFSFSPDGQQMIYLSIDDEEVSKMKFTLYGEPGDLADQYTTEVNIPYPKPGTTLPTYEVWHFNFTSKSARIVSKSQEGKDLVYGWRWIDNRMLSVVYTNRVQNVSQIEICDLNTRSCKRVYQDANEKGWANFETPFFSKDGRMLLRTRQKAANKEYYHLNIINRNGVSHAVTYGTFTVTNILNWDEENKLVYYTASAAEEPSADHVHVVHEGGRSEPRCLTCNVLTPEGLPCKSGTVDFNANFSHFVAYCRGPGPSTVSVYRNILPLGKPVRILFENAEIRRYLKNRLKPKIMNLRVGITETMEAEVRLYLPPELDAFEKRKYPLLIYVYGGPDAHQIKENFVFDWSLYLTTNRSIIYGIIDGRGAGNKETEMLYAVYRALGTVEVQDQITVTRYLKNRLDFIDKGRIGIWGWSYGGYSTAKVLEEDKEGLFRCGVSVAPVADWIYYDSVYTERYMNLPTENERGYRGGSLLHNVDNLRNKTFLLIHGTADDNVHFQHSMSFAKVLERNDILFEQQAYPDEDHAIYGFKFHVYRTMDKFWRKCFEMV